jgi:hypothetical protein
MKTTEQKLNEMFEAFKKEVLKEFSEENEFKVGKWYTSKENTKKMWYIVNVFADSQVSFGFSDSGVWQNEEKRYSFFKEFRPATDKEVESALIAEAKRRGFKEGVEVKSLTRDKLMLRFETLCFFDNGLVDKWGSFIFKNGKWAEIVEDKIMIGGYEVKKIYHANKERVFYKIGCKEITQTTLENIYLFMTNNELKKVAFDGIETDLETIEKILKL